MRGRRMRHEDVYSEPYAFFIVGVEARRWGFGFKLNDYADRGGPPIIGLRVMFWRWDWVFHIYGKD